MNFIVSKNECGLPTSTDSHAYHYAAEIERPVMYDAL